MQFVQWGVSNFSPEVLEKMLNLCEEKGLQKPSCYQGEYNLVTRAMETKLLPTLRAHGVTYNAFRCARAPSSSLGHLSYLVQKAEIEIDLDCIDPSL